jgi:hypothetical protein
MTAALRLPQSRAPKVAVSRHRAPGRTCARGSFVIIQPRRADHEALQSCSTRGDRRGTARPAAAWEWRRGATFGAAVAELCAECQR